MAASWALVIGSDMYWRPDARLRGAVRDALDMREWLLDPNGGNVPAGNLELLLAPDVTKPGDHIPYAAATFDNMVLALERILARSGGTGDRFFFHFSGHGLTARGSFSNQSAIAFTDFTDILPNHAMTVKSIFERLQATQFAEQFFFIDACRNIPFDTEKRLGEYPNPVPPDASFPQFVMYATQPGVKALEIRQPGSEHGAFTATLLAGLRGTGAAKRWEDNQGRFVVRWNSLFEAVERDVRNRRLQAAQTPGGPLIQVPSQYGERGSQNPILGEFAQTAFGDEDLTVNLDPGSVAPSARVDVQEYGSAAGSNGPPISGLPVKFQLPPRTYRVVAQAPGYLSQPPATVVDLYEPIGVEFKLIPGVPGGGTPGFPSLAPLPFGPVSPTPSGSEGGRLPVPRPVSLFVTSDDGLTHLELTDNAGRILQSGRSPLHDTLEPGFYRARVISPEGEAHEQHIDLQSGSEPIVSVTVHVPEPRSEVLGSLLKQARFSLEPSGTVSPSEAVGPSAWLQLSTFLALAAAASLESDSSHGQRLRGLGVPAFQHLTGLGSTSGIQVVLGFDDVVVPDWSEAAVWCTELGGPKRHLAVLRESSPHYGRLVPALQLPSAVSAGLALQPGVYQLGLQLEAGAALTLPVSVLKGRVTLVIATRSDSSAETLHLYMPVLTGPATLDYQFRDPRFYGSRFPAIRRIELMQRAVASGRLTPTMPDIEELLLDKWSDPIAGCLGGYLLVRAGETRKLEVPAHNLITHFGLLPDAHVLQGVLLEKTEANPTEVNAAFTAALDLGLPMFRDGLALLHAAIERRGLAHWREDDVRRLLAEVPAGALWSSRARLAVPLSRDPQPDPRDEPEAFGASAASASV